MQATTAQVLITEIAALENRYLGKRAEKQAATGSSTSTATHMQGKSRISNLTQAQAKLLTAAGLLTHDKHTNLPQNNNKRDATEWTQGS